MKLKVFIFRTAQRIYSPLRSFGSSWWKWKMTSAFLSLPGMVLVQSFFMKNTWYVNWGVEPGQREEEGTISLFSSNIDCMLIIIILTISGWPGLLNPIREVSDEVEEEVSFWDGDHLVRDLDKETEALTGAKI